MAIRLFGKFIKFVGLAGPLANLDGTASIPSASRSPAPTNSALPPFTPDDKTKFLRIFVGAGPMNGLLSGMRNLLSRKKSLNFH